VNDVAPKVDAEISSDGSGQGLLWVGLSHHHTTSLGCVLSFPDHGNDGTGRDEVDEFVVEWLVFQIDVMLLDMLFGSLHKLHGDELEAALFKSLNNVTDKSALDSVRLHHDESAVRVRHG